MPSDAQGDIVRGQIDGRLVMRSYLHGEPQITLSFNPDLFVRNRSMHGPTASLPFDDITFHDCINTSSFDSARSLWLRPPHGQIDSTRSAVLLMPAARHR